MDPVDSGLPFVRGVVPPSFERRIIEIGPGGARPFVPTDWVDALVVVERGRLELECHEGGRRPFATGAILCLAGLPLRALHNPGCSPTVLVSVARRDPGRAVAPQPRILEEPDQPYVAIRETVTAETFAAVAARIPELYAWLAARRIEPAGAPFIRFHVIDSDRELDIEAAVPVDEPVAGSGDVRAGVLPAGRYATVYHVGHPDELLGVTAHLLEWAALRGLEWDVTDTDRGAVWGGRVERCLTDPCEEPDRARWETELAFRLSDGE